MSKRIQKTTRHQNIIILSALLVFGTHCGKTVSRIPAPSAEQAIENLRSGSLIRAIENQNASASPTPAPDSTPEASATPEPSSSSLPEPAASAEPAPAVTNPCLNPVAEVSDLGKCLREQLSYVDLITKALEFYKTFQMPKTGDVLSLMTEVDLKAFLAANDEDLIESFMTKSKNTFRASYTNAELDELLTLVIRKRQELDRAKTKIFAALDLHRPLVEAAAKDNNRYRALLAFRDAAKSADPKILLEALLKSLKDDYELPCAIERFPADLLNPYALTDLVPAVGMEEQPMSYFLENPFTAALLAQAELGGNSDDVARTLNTYKKIRDIDNPELRAFVPPGKSPARVAVLDTGVDFVQYPELETFLEGGADYADGDLNPYLPAMGDTLSHGSGTTASVLTVLAHYAPEGLQKKNIAVNVWKTYSIRNLLSGTSSLQSDWKMRFSLQEGILAQILRKNENNPESPLPPPHVVSVSMAFGFQPLLEAAKQTDVLKKAPWLWVMAAGNSAVTMATDQIPPCFSDVPKANRMDERTLCVGALVRGILTDRIAYYSNYGDRVDIYTYESFTGLCPNGTSCSTPAISAAAIALKERYPTLTPEQIKKALVKASVSRELIIDLDYGNPHVKELADLGLIESKRTVNFFDPTTMLPKAFEEARKLAKH